MFSKFFENRRTRFLFKIEIILFKLKIKKVEMNFVLDILTKYCAGGGGVILHRPYTVLLNKFLLELLLKFFHAT